jgi:enoyl-CoA hydratase/carnithine racemase
MAPAEDMAARILRNDRQAVESAKETIMDVIGRQLDDQLKIEALLGYAICGDNPAIAERSQAFFEKRDAGRVGTNPTPIQGVSND